MKTRILILFTRTPMHVGAGSSVGAIDRPIVRERHTGFPIVPGSALKGVLADLFNEKNPTRDGAGTPKTGGDGASITNRSGDAEKLFGSDDGQNASAGHLLIGEARALAFPVRSAKGSFAWVTCPLALRRFRRDGGDMPDVEDAALKDMDCYAGDAVAMGNDVVLEEYKFAKKRDSKPWAEKFVPLADDPVWKGMSGRLVVLTDEMFGYFAAQACEIATRIRIDDETGTVANGALFNQEQVPSETMFYSVLMETRDGCLSILETKLKASDEVIQIGGDATIGLGYCSVGLRAGKGK